MILLKLRTQIAIIIHYNPSLGQNHLSSESYLKLNFLFYSHNCEQQSDDRLRRKINQRSINPPGLDLNKSWLPMMDRLC